jgi:hypothetical protein
MCRVPLAACQSVSAAAAALKSCMTRRCIRVIHVLDLDSESTRDRWCQSGPGQIHDTNRVIHHTGHWTRRRRRRGAGTGPIRGKGGLRGMKNVTRKAISGSNAVVYVQHARTGALSGHV